MGFLDEVRQNVREYPLSYALAVVVLLCIVALMYLKEGMDGSPSRFDDPNGIRYQGTRDDTGFGWGGSLTPQELMHAHEDDVAAAEKSLLAEGFIGREMSVTHSWPQQIGAVDYHDNDGRKLNVLAHKGSRHLAEHSNEGDYMNILRAQ